MTERDAWQVFVLETADKFEKLQKGQAVAGDVVHFIDAADAITSEALREFLINSIDEMDGFPDLFAELVKLLNLGVSEQQLVQHMDAHIR